MSSEPFRISLNATDFDCLVNGGVVIVDHDYDKGTGLNIEIALQDIGFDAMTRCISQARFNTQAIEETRKRRSQDSNLDQPG